MNFCFVTQNIMNPNLFLAMLGGLVLAIVARRLVRFTGVQATQSNRTRKNTESAPALGFDSRQAVCRVDAARDKPRPCRGTRRLSHHSSCTLQKRIARSLTHSGQFSPRDSDARGLEDLAEEVEQESR